MWVQSLGQKDPLDEETATHNSNLAWRSPWREELGGIQSIWWQRVGIQLKHVCVQATWENWFSTILEWFYYLNYLTISFFFFFTFKGILSYSSDTESFMLKAISTLFSVSFCFISFWSCINRCIIHLWLFKSSWRTDSYNYETVLYFWQYFFS